MGESGILGEDDRVELLDGRLVDMPPIGPSHSHGVDDFLELFTRRLYADDPPSARVRVQSPIQLDAYGVPQPDACCTTQRCRRIGTRAEKTFISLSKSRTPVWSTIAR